MTRRRAYDAIVVGAGPNGLAAAVTVARAGRSVLVLERRDTIGGGSRTEALTLDGFLHDTCASVHALTAASPFLRTLPLERHGLRWCHPPLELVHPLADGDAAVLSRSLDTTAASLGPDGARYRAMVEPLIGRWRDLADGLLAPMMPPRHPLAMARFARTGLPNAQALTRRFDGRQAPALIAGLAAHSCIRLDHPMTAGLALVLGLAGHVDGWPFAEGGSGAVTGALAAYLRELGGEIETARPVRALDELPPAKVVLADVSPRQLAAMAGTRAVRRFRYGAGVFKLDYALSEPVPWTSPAARQAGTLHVGGTLAEIARAERTVANGHHSARPFVLASQPTVADPSRAPEGRQVLWAYCHVPNGSTEDMTEAVEAQIERFAPGFRDVILIRRARTTADLERENPNLIGGDIAGGALNGLQLVARPQLTLHPYRTSMPGVYQCSASTPPGAGVHGMCGHFAALDALGRELR